ncbi:hypothetical protein SAMN02745221_00459 [Thermosyntropha lipolytica DSM 11003]|uniref:DUF2197 domain-containing protein n=1 Tax=Thermosyntropha lipolytica DSM 11003 TaxID=1123382 RepID=A0A1M5KSX9_9FIRM|nr:DUF2197 domain-containing protein [Thermosyntropha lipolytica]SHG55881.1 hypothetical protein SAMN02745221_00459 [Thermosyntropha lipolytica DSM 11003]
MKQVTARCIMCGKTYDVAEDHKDYPKLVQSKDAVFVCDRCNYKVRYESEEEQKPKKPM